MAAVDVVSIAVLLWRNDRATDLLVLWSNLVVMAACLMCAHSISVDTDHVVPDAPDVPVVPARDAVVRQSTAWRDQSLARPADVSPSAGVPSAARAAASLDDFPSEADGPSQRRAG